MNEVDAAITQLLTSDATCMSIATEVCNTVGAQDTQFPFYIFSKTPRRDEDGQTFTGRAFRRLEYIVKAVDTGLSKDRAQQMADNADAVLNDCRPTIGGWDVQHWRRIGSVDYMVTAPYVATNEIHIGGIYEITLIKE